MIPTTVSSGFEDSNQTFGNYLRRRKSNIVAQGSEKRPILRLNGLAQRKEIGQDTKGFSVQFEEHR
jgi:hypothetical protein